MSAEAFDHFADQIAHLASRRGANEVRLVLLGDGLDIVRSTQWLDLPPACRPWSAPGAAQECVTLDILKATLDHNAQALEHLRQLPERVADQTRIAPNRVRLSYVLGNHDWLIQRYPSTRRLVAEHLRLPRVYAEHGFPLEFVSRPEAYDVVARHGHQFDRQNCDFAAGPAAPNLGDAIVVELVNRFPVAVAEELAGDPAAGEILRRLQEIDNVRPYAHIPAWIMETSLELAQDHPQFLVAARRAAGRCIAEFCASPIIGDMRRRHLSWLERLYLNLMLQQVRYTKASSLRRWTAVADRALSAWRLLANQPEAEYTAEAQAERGPDGRPPRLVVYGHTHSQTTVPLGPQPGSGADRFYINSGTWRPVWEMARTADGSLHFAAWKEMSYVVIYAAGEGRGTHEFEIRSGSLRDRPDASGVYAVPPPPPPRSAPRAIVRRGRTRF